MTDKTDQLTPQEPELTPEKEKASPPRIAHSISVTRCCTEGCDCDQVFINLHDEEDGVFAYVPMPSSVGYVVAGDIADACDAVREKQAAVRASKAKKH